MLESIVFVVRRVYWEAPDESHDEWLTLNHQWSRKSVDAYTYQSVAVFTHATEMGGGAFLRMPSGRELPIFEVDFSPLWDQKVASDSRLRRHR